MDLDKNFNEFKKDFKMDDAANNQFQATPKSSVKLVKNTKGINWEIKLVQGEEDIIEGLMLKAVDVHKKLKEEVE